MQPIQIFSKGEKFIIKHSPAILTGLAIGGMFTSVVLACKCKTKADLLLDEERQRQLRDGQEFYISPWQKVKIVAPAYWPVALTTGFSALCMIFAQSVNVRRNAALVAAYELSESTLKEYKDEIKQRFGKTEEEKIREKVMQKQVNANPPSKELILANPDKLLCYDSFSGRYFYSTKSDLERVEARMNRRLRDEMYLSVNDFYDEIDIPHTNAGDCMGWSFNSMSDIFELVFTPIISEDGRLGMGVDYNVEPSYDFRDY